AAGVEKNLTTLVQFFENQPLKLAATPSIWPTKGWVTSAFGWRNDPFTGKRAFHKGIDIATNLGNPVVATADGVVVQTKIEKIGGKTIIISHRGGYTTVYCHLNKFLVRPGQRVKRGDVIGEVGKTGKALGPHVHYEVRVNGKPVNPYYYILEE
ncbi:MAG: M23 family metallopeptidase, partial [Candidatus Aminicenantales bacterium]